MAQTSKRKITPLMAAKAIKQGARDAAKIMASRPKGPKCYSERVLLDWSLGKLPKSEMKEVAAHMDKCLRCVGRAVLAVSRSIKAGRRTKIKKN